MEGRKDGTFVSGGLTEGLGKGENSTNAVVLVCVCEGKGVGDKRERRGEKAAE